jgi:hypothetical protein
MTRSGSEEENKTQPDTKLARVLKEKSPNRKQTHTMATSENVLKASTLTTIPIGLCVSLVMTCQFLRRMIHMTVSRQTAMIIIPATMIADSFPLKGEKKLW